MDVAQLLQEKREEILHLAAKHGASNVRIFGSMARGEARPDSDVDFLVELEAGRSLNVVERNLPDLKSKILLILQELENES